MSIGNRNKEIPLCVDLDGTLIRSDTLAESALALLHTKPHIVFTMLLWLLRGRAVLKSQIATRVNLDVSNLPYDRRVVELIHNESSRRPVYLCTAADSRIADQVATYVGGFDGVIASDGRQNLVGHNKGQALVDRFGERGYDYAGNERRDLHIWRHAHGAIVANATSALPERVATHCEVLQVFPPERSSISAWIKAIRLHQWLKNLLVFVPILAAHLVLRTDLSVRALAAFVIFSLCASSVYLLNDLLDIEDDRAHPRKRHRPFAAGIIPIYRGILVALILTIVAYTGAYLVTPAFAAVLLGYHVLTFAYSTYLKRIAMVDVIVLAGLYTIRIIAGAEATDISVSKWLLIFSMFLFLSLALVKRYAEIQVQLSKGATHVRGRGYYATDYELLASLGGASGYISVLVLGLYINSAPNLSMYRHPDMLWLLCPILIYWISRVWIIAHRGAMHDDPLVFAFSDRVSRILGILFLMVVLLALI